MKTIRVAVVGCGRISDLHQLGYRGREDTKIVAVCDTNKSQARKKAAEWGVEKVYYDYNQVLEDREVDLVELLTPHHLHCPMTVQAAQAGKHISVQKPMATLRRRGRQRTTTSERCCFASARMAKRFSTSGRLCV